MTAGGLELVRRAEQPDDHAWCTCGGLMCFDAATGLLICNDCHTDVLTNDTTEESEQEDQS